MSRFLPLSLAVLLSTASLAQAQRIPVTTASDDARVHYVRAVHATANVDFDDARAHLDAALDADPQFAMAHLYRSILSGGEERAEHMRQATAASANASEGERQMIESQAANLRDDHESEEALLMAAAERYPGDPMPMFWWASTEMNRGNNAESVAAAKRALAADAAFAPAYNLIGYAEMAAGNGAAAEKAFREQIRLAPDESNPYDSFGEFYLEQGRLDEAEAQYQMALTKNPALANARTMLARIGIERVNRAFEAAVADGDAEAVAALYTATAVVSPPNMASVEGREAIAELFTGYVVSGIDGLHLKTTEVRTMGDFAHEIGTGTIHAGGEVVDEFKFSVLWAKVGNDWRLHRDIWNSDRPQAQTTAATQ